MVALIQSAILGALMILVLLNVIAVMALARALRAAILRGEAQDRELKLLLRERKFYLRLIESQDGKAIEGVILSASSDGESDTMEDEARLTRLQKFLDRRHPVPEEKKLL